MAELTLEETGAYNLLLDHAYARDGNLPDNDQLIKCMLRCHGDRWLAIKARLITKRKIEIRNGLVVPNGVEKTLKRAGNVSETSRKRSRKTVGKFRKTQ